MKRSSSLSSFRWSLILILVIGLFLLFVFFQPFGTIANWLNGLASDGNFESFTLERYQTLSKVTGVLGLLFTLFPALALIRWVDTQKALEWMNSKTREFNLLLRQDAKSFWNSVSLSKWKKSDLVLMGGLILVALIVRLASLNIPLSHDEAYTYNAFASRSLWVTVSDYHLPNNHVFLTVIVNILTHLFGNHLWLIRLPTILVGTLMVPAAYWFGKRFYSKETGLLGAALVAVFPVLVEYSALARGYIIVALFTLLVLTFGDHIRESKNRFVWLLLIITNALGFFTIPIMLFPFGALYIWLFLSCIVGDINGYRSKFDFLKYWLVSGFASALLTVILYAPILIGDSANFFGNSFVLPVKKALFPAVFQSRMELAWFDWTHSIPMGLVMLALIGFALSVLFHFKIARSKIPLQLVFFVWIGFYLIARRPDMMTRMWLYLAAPVLVWSASGLIETLRWIASLFRRQFPLAQIFFGISLVAVFVYGVYTLTTIPTRWSQKSSVEGAVLYLKDTLHEGDLVTASVEYFPQLRYYFGIYGIDQEYLRKSGEFQRLFIVMGEKERRTLEDVVPMVGKHLDLPAVDIAALKIVLQFNDLLIYEGAYAR